MFGGKELMSSHQRDKVSDNSASSQWLIELLQEETQEVQRQRGPKQGPLRAPRGWCMVLVNAGSIKQREWNQIMLRYGRVERKENNKILKV